jgi:hypothetical protein
MSSVIVAGNVSGSVTLDAPAVSGSTVITLPTVSGTMLTNKSVGTILQVVNATTNVQVTSSTTTYADTGLSATITPSSATNKILVIFSHSCKKTSGNVASGVNIKLFRGATDLGQLIYAQGYSNSTIENYSQAATQYLDSPATTSATTYKTQFANNAAVASVAVQADGNGVSTITLMEIAA